MKNLLRKIWKAIEENQQRRADYWILQNLSERELRDIGVARAEIKRIIYDN